MIAIVCVDNKNGVSFNHRRQSQDKSLIAEILNIVDDKPLFISPYSKSLFPDDANITIIDDFDSLSESDFAFVEDKISDISLTRVNKLILCRWNRDYPSDVMLPFDITSLQLQSSREISGNSHDTITIESYTDF